MIVYMEVTMDEYELPVAVANTVGELAMITNSTVNAIRTGICREGKGIRNSRFKKVLIDECEDD